MVQHHSLAILSEYPSSSIFKMIPKYAGRELSSRSNACRSSFDNVILEELAQHVSESHGICWCFILLKHDSYVVTWENSTLGVSCNAAPPQDMRLRTADTKDNAIVCNNEKLASGGTAEYLREANAFLRKFIFAKDTYWPDAILALSMLVTREDPQTTQYR